MTAYAVDDRPMLPHFAPLYVAHRSAPLPPLEGDDADAQEFAAWYDPTPGSPGAVLTIARHVGGGWRVAYALSGGRDDDGARRLEASAMIFPTYAAAHAAAMYARAILAGAVRLHVRAVAPAMLEAVRQLQQPPPPAGPPADDPAPTGRHGRVVPFRSRADALTPTG